MFRTLALPLAGEADERCAAGACQAPTQIELDITTDADCAAFETSIYVDTGPSFADDAVPQTVTQRCVAGQVGTLVLTPSGARDGRVLVMVTGREPGRPPIVAKRSIRYLPRRPIVLPIRLSRACAGVQCPDQETCVDGECRGWNVDPETCLGDAGCGEDTLPRVDGGVDAGSDAGAAKPVQALAAGGNTTCARTWSGELRCWGDNRYGQCGDGTTTTPRTSPAAPVPLGMGALAVAVGHGFACGYGTSREVRCWGRNEQGQLGRGTVSSLETALASNPVTTGATVIAAGWGRACAASSGTGSALQCWGNGDAGTLGGMLSSASPIGLSVPATPTALAVGARHVCAIVDSSLYCWGAKITDPQPSPVFTPTQVSGVPSPTGVAAGEDFTCVLLASREVRCFGDNLLGQAGIGNLAMRIQPTTGPNVTGLTKVSEIAAGAGHACAVTTSGEVWCWGLNDEGQLGDGTTTNSSTPKKVPLADGAAEHVAAGSQHTCVTLRAGGVRCWGRNTDGELGNGSAGPRSTAPVAVLNL
jgi:alpha-tubulin suppressor-like RCC1 family protein